jgi:hypothetical protein
LRIETDYVKKARGTLLAESRVTLPSVEGDTDFDVTADIRDGSGEVVARVRVKWRLGLAR